jgi:hypothetical protein
MKKLLLLTVLLTSCSSIPPSVRTFAHELKMRGNGQYAVVDEPIRKELVMKDAGLGCKIDVEDGVAEKDSAACRCAYSASPDWAADCAEWMGAR